MTDFSSIDSNGQNIPFSGKGLTDNALGLFNPDNSLSGQLRGTQNVGSGGAALDAANNRIVLTNPLDGSTVGFGIIPGSTTGEFGFFGQDSTGNMIFKIVNGTYYVYDISTGKNIIQLGKLPDASYGQATAKAGYNVSDGVS